MSDLNNDGKIDEADNSLLSAGLKENATDEEKEKGTEYIFVDDDVSNGLWDVGDPDAPSGQTDDDDVQELKIKLPDFGQVWFEHGIIDKLNFYKTKACNPADKLTFPYDLAGTEPFPETVYLRAEKDITVQIDGNLSMWIGKDKATVWSSIDLPLTVIREFGDEKFFHAARDYILENNTEIFVHDKGFPSDNPTTTIRICAMREEATTMSPFESYHDDAYKNFVSSMPPSGTVFEPELHTSFGLGIDGAISAGPGMTVVINGNQCDFTDPTMPDPRTEAGRIERLANLSALSLLGESQLTDRSHGRFIIAGVQNATSSDHDDPTALLPGTSFRGSYLAGDDPIAGSSNAGGKYIAQNSDGSFVMGAGYAGGSNAVGGLSGNYSSSDRDNYPNSFVGFSPMQENGEEGKGVVFVAMGKGANGAGKVESFYNAAKSSGVPEIPGATPSGSLKIINLVMLDSGDTSCAMAHKNPSGNFKTVFKGSKHNGFPYYTNTFLRFKSQKPRGAGQ